MHSFSRFATIASTCLAALATVVSAQQADQQASASAQGAGRGGAGGRGGGAAVSDSALINSLPIRSIGPAVMSGRVSDVAVAESPGARGGSLGTVVYLAAATGGVWKSTNGGANWRPIFDEANVGSVGDIAVAPSNSNIVWAGTGEANNMRSSSWGDGVYKSTDGGASWQHMGLKKSQHIGRIVIHPTDPNIVYVAAVGPLWGPGGERGLFKTTDGGRSWTNTKSIDANTGFTDVVMDPTNPDILYAASLQRERRAFSYVGGGPESGIWKTVDAGKTWTRLTEGFSKAPVGRVGLDVCRSQPGTLYAVVEGREGGVYRSDDHGASWRRTSTMTSIPWFFGQIRCNPKDPEKVIHLGVPLVESSDGGVTFGTNIGSGTHSDHHALWINPEDPDHMILGNDGGLYVTRDHGRSWDWAVDLPISQFYAIGIDMQEPFYGVYGGLQDNSTFGGPSQTRFRTGITNYDWFRMAGGDGFYAAVDPTDHHIAYVESQNGALVRFDGRTGEGKSIRPQVKPGEKPLRFNWSAPIVISPHDNRTIYFAAQYVFKSTDRGDSWTQLGGDLTRQIDRNRLAMMGKVPGSDAVSRHEGTAEFGNISTIDESPVKKGVLIAGTDDGVVQISTDDGKTWRKTERFPGVPDTTYVSRVIASKHNENTFYVTFDGHRSNDFKPYVLRTTNAGQSWTSIAGNLPEGSVHVIREHHRNPSLLVVGTEYAPYVSVDGGGSWTRIRNGLPPVPVHDVIIHPRDNDLIIGTHGRGIWIMDDISPIENLAQAKQAAVAHLFPVEPTTQFALNGTRSLGSGSRSYSGANPPVGAAISYVLKTVPQGGSVTLSVVDASGAQVRELPVASRPGLHRVMWDMRIDAPYSGPRAAAAPAAGGRGGAGGGGGGGGAGGRGGAANATPAGPLALPGQYRARLVVAGAQGAPTVLEQPIVLRKDPMVMLTDAEMKQLYEMRVNVAQLQAKLTMALRNADEAKSTVTEARTAIRTMTTPPAAVSREADAINRELDDIIAKLRGAQGGGRGGGGGGAQRDEEEEEGAPARQQGGIAVQQRLQTASGINNSSSMPTQYQREALTDVPADLEREIQRLNAVMQRVPAFIASLDAAGVPWTPGRPVRIER